MKRFVLLFAFFCVGIGLSATWGTWNGVTVGSSSKNISALDGITIGTASKNYGAWNGLVSPAGVGTISHINNFQCYPCTSLSATSVVSGDLIIAFAMGASATTIGASLASPNCSSSGQGTEHTDGNWGDGRSFWCVANATTVAVTVTTCPSDCGMEIVQYRTTTTWNTSSFLNCGGAVSVATNLTLCAINPTNSVNLVTGAIVDEDNGETMNAVSPWIQAGRNNGQSNSVAYKVGLSSGSTQVVFTGTGPWLGLAIAFSTN